MGHHMVGIHSDRLPHACDKVTRAKTHGITTEWHVASIGKCQGP